MLVHFFSEKSVRYSSFLFDEFCKLNLLFFTYLKINVWGSFSLCVLCFIWGWQQVCSIVSDQTVFFRDEDGTGFRMFYQDFTWSCKSLKVNISVEHEDAFQFCNSVSVGLLNLPCCIAAYSLNLEESWWLVWPVGVHPP